MTTEAQIMEYTFGLPSDKVAYMIKGMVQIPVTHIEPINHGTSAEAILQMLKDGWTAIPF
jgi:hypothetical protein